MFSFLHRVACVATLIATALCSAYSQAAIRDQEVADDICEQPREIKEELMAVAERESCNIVWVEVSGNESTRYREFRKRFALGLEEGDIFSRKVLDESIKRLSKFRKIHPISIGNVGVRLDRENQSIDIVFCVRER